jgi:Protein of unknown function (DUF1254)
MHSIAKAVSLALIIGLVGGCDDDRAKMEAEEVGDRSELIPVSLENYEVAESDLAFNNVAKIVGTNQFLHFPMDEFDLSNQVVVRMNQDTVYSAAVVNASAGATVTLPETDGRYLTVMIAQNDHYVDQVFKTPGEHVIESDT